MRRRGRHLWLLVPGVLAVLLLGIAGVLAVQVGSIQQGRSQWEAGQPDRAEASFGRAVDVAVVQRWVPYYDRGLARIELRRWDAAAADLESAASLAPPEQQCRVRLAWAAALEGGADTLADAEDVPGALLRYQQALAVLAVASCSEEDTAESADEEQPLADEWQESRQRLENKRSQGQRTWTPPPEQPPSTSDPQQELAERERDAAAERQQAEEDRRGDDSSGGGAGEKTW